MAPGVEEELQQLKEKLSQAESANKSLQRQLLEAEQSVREEGHAEQVCSQVQLFMKKCIFCSNL